MTKMAALLPEVSQAMNKMSSSAYLSVKELLVSASWKYCHECPERKHPEAPPMIVMKRGGEMFKISGNHLCSMTNITAALLYTITVATFSGHDEGG